MRIVWSGTAVTNLIGIRQYIERDKREAARQLAHRIISAVERLAVHPHLGCPGREPGTRELIVAGTPYIIPYRVRQNQVSFLAILHAAQDRAD